jgi:excisionase family DNA binding protein
MKLTVPEAARRVGRNPETIRRWIWSGKLPSEKVGNQHVIDEEALEALLPAVEPEEDDEPTDVPEEWEEWLKKTRELHRKLRARGARIPPAADILREQRRSR